MAMLGWVLSKAVSDAFGRPKMNHGTWVCSLIAAINATRARIEPGYIVAVPETVAEAVALAMPLDPYP